MTNNILAADISGVKVLLTDGNTRIVTLQSPNAANTETLHDISDDANYQVPTGKKFTIIFIVAADFATANDRIISSTAADATTGEVILYEPAASITNEIFVQSNAAAVAADLFVTKVASAADNCKIIGVEEDA